MAVMVLAIAGLSFSVGVKAATKNYDNTHVLKWDINGDGKNDTIKFVPKSADYWSKENLTVWINGKKVLSLNDNFYDYSYKKLELKNGKRFLAIWLSWDNGDGPVAVYSYKGGKLKKVTDFSDVKGWRWIDNIKTKNNQLIVRMSDSGGSGLGHYDFRTIYDYNKGKFILHSRTHAILAVYQFDESEGSAVNSRQLTTKHSLTLYSDKAGNEVKYEIPADEKVVITKSYIKGSEMMFYIKNSEYSGWVRPGDYSDYYFDDYMFYNIMGVA